MIPTFKLSLQVDLVVMSAILGGTYFTVMKHTFTKLTSLMLVVFWTFFSNCNKTVPLILEFIKDAVHRILLKNTTRPTLQLPLTINGE